MHDDDTPHVLNYLRITMPGHPLADMTGRLPLHRWIVYQRLGDGPHPCHWCGVLLNWLPTRQRWADAIVVDHVDGNLGNNDEANLVVSCNPCNIWRGHGGRLQDDELTVQLASGRSRAVEQVCAWCDKPYLTRKSRAGEQRFCSRRCGSSWARRQPELAAKMGAIITDDEPHILRRSRDGTISRLRGIPRTCQQCGAPCVVTPQHLKEETGNFCSHACAGKVNGTHGNHRRGAAHPHVRLTEANVREMRQLWAAGGITLEALGARFGVTKSCTNMVVNRRSWKYIE